MLGLGRWLTILSENCSKPLNDAQLEVYGQGLQDLTPEEIHLACSRALLEWKFLTLPPVAVLREYAGRHAQQEPKDADRITLAAETEWEAIVHHVQWLGVTMYRSDPPLVLTAAGEFAFRRIGWREAVGTVNPENLHWVHKNFIEAFQMHAETDGLKQLPQAEAENLLSKTRHLISTTRKVTSDED